MVAVALTGMEPLHTGCYQGAAEMCQIDVTHQSPLVLPKHFKNIGKREQLAWLIQCCGTEMAAEDFFFGWIQ